MNKYEIDFGYGRAQLWTTAPNDEAALADFWTAANKCFGIRKSITADPRVSISYGEVGLPADAIFVGVPEEVIVVLTHGWGDRIVFRRDITFDGGFWKLRSEWDDVCSCREHGKPELSCEVHEWWAKNDPRQPSMPEPEES